MAPDEMKVHLLTRGAYYHGALRYSEAPGAARPRLLDFLNAQARGRQGLPAKAVPMLHLDDADVTVYRGDEKVAVRAPSVSVAVRAVVVAFDEGPAKRDSIGPQATYEKRLALDEEPLVILTRTRHRLVGKVRGGVRRLTVRTADEPFVAVTGVSIEDLSTGARRPAALSFVALNMEFVEAYWEA
ncbi:MAG: hypothetical protein QME96_11425 [Myxococcota bacterium]|nr:hypothetical protein [Myxococcota bacterium]